MSARFSDSETYDYLLIREGGKVVDSSWITPSSERPDYISVPGRIDLEASADPAQANAHVRALRDLARLIRSCPRLSHLTRFFGMLREYKADNRISPEEAAELQTAFARTGGLQGQFIHRDLLRSELTQNGRPIPGLRLSDFGLSLRKSQ
jgi:hypothetical protein